MELGLFDKHFIKKTQEKEVMQGNSLKTFPLSTLKCYILNGKFNLKMEQSGPFFVKKADEAFPLHLVNHPGIWISIPEYA